MIISGIRNMSGAQGDPGSSTSVLERTETEVKPSKGDGDNERFAHYVRKDKATASAVTGSPVVALCGKVWVPLRDPSGFPVCPKCKAIHEQMKTFGPNWPFGADGE